MAGFLVVIDPGFDRDLWRLRRGGGRDAVDRVLAVLPRLVEDPVTRRPGFDTRRIGLLPGHAYRLRVGDCRVLYEVDREERTVLVSTVYRVGRRWRGP